jgi:peptidoglycan/xylan/chitin deacetylase (PgdA/CDA1 family)
VLAVAAGRDRYVTARALVLALVSVVAAGQGRRFAITIDDLPLGGGSPGPCTTAHVMDVTERLLAPIREWHVPAIGFVNEGRCSEIGPANLRRVLALWLDAGADLGNHTYSHMDLNSHTAREFEEDVVRGEGVLRPLLKSRGKKLLYLRHPFLHVGDEAGKRKEVEAFLKGRGYRIAPITLDNSDFMFAAVYGRALARGDRELAKRVRDAYIPYMDSVVAFFERRSVAVTGHEVAQTLLIHVSELNADMMPELLAMFERRGYTFITLDEALKDPAYLLEDRYTGPGGISWIHHWSMTKRMPYESEPDEPSWIGDAYRATRR